jgi:hypothetical protein
MSSIALSRPTSAVQALVSHGDALTIIMHQKPISVVRCDRAWQAVLGASSLHPMEATIAWHYIQRWCSARRSAASHRRLRENMRQQDTPE